MAMNKTINKNRRHFVFKLLLLMFLSVISSIYLFPILIKNISLFDEGTILAGADRVQKGDVPYTDFWTIYPPGQYYVLAFLFDVFGSSLLVERIYDIFVKSMLSISIFLVIGKLVFSNAFALIGWALSVVWIGHLTLAAYPVYPALLLSYAAVYFILCYWAEGGNLPLVFCGMSVTLSALFRHDLAGFTAVSILSGLLVRGLLSGKLDRKGVGLYLVSYLIIGFPILVYILNHISFRELYNQLILIPADVIPKYRWLPYPAFTFMNRVFFIFPSVVALGLITFVFRILRKREGDNTSYGIFVISLQGILFFNQARVRSDIFHLLPVALSSIVLISILWSCFSSRLPMKIRWAAHTVFISLLCVTFASSFEMKFKSISKEYFILRRTSKLERAGFSGIPVALEQVISYIQNSTTEDETIYVGVMNHDKSLVNCPAVYYLSERNYSSRFHQFEFGVSNTVRAQKQIVKELESSSTRKLVLTNGYWFEPNGTRVDLKIDIIDGYIRKFYTLETRYGGFEIWNRTLQ